MVEFRGVLVGAIMIAMPFGPAIARSGTQDGPPLAQPARFVAHRDVRYDQSREGIEMGSGEGVLRTNRFYGDFTMRFQFQLIEQNTEAVVFVRTLFPGASAPPSVGYRIHLSDTPGGSPALGRVTGWQQDYASGPLRAAALSGREGDWQHGEIKIVGSTLTLTINGVETTHVTNLDQLLGYSGFQVVRGRLRVRGVQIQPLPTWTEGFPGAALRLGEGIVNPVVIKEVKPRYSMETLRDRVQGVVVTEIVVREDGTVSDVKVIRSLHHDLDESAIAAARQWRFQPATKEGKPVAVVATLDLTFKIFNK